MVRVWVIAALAACSPAGADDRAAQLPAGWKPLPPMAAAVTAAINAEPIVVDRVEAAGDPASGCYAVWLELHGGRAGESALADAIVAGMQGLAIHDVVMPTGGDPTLTLGFAKAPHRGQLRARLGAGRIAAVACFANEREPARCEATCGKLLAEAR